MKRNFRHLLTLTALAATLAFHGSAMAGKGFSLGGGGGGISGGMRSSMGSSHMARSPVSGGMQLKSHGHNFAKGPSIGNLGGINRGIGSQAIQPTVRHMGQPSNFTKHLQGQVMNGNFPKVNPNVVQGNVRNNLLGNGSGANPKLGIQLGNGPKIGGHGGGPGIAGQIQGGINKHVGVQLGGGGGVHGKFCATPVKGKADCRHVIDMLVRHCVGNQCYDPCVKQYCPDPRWAQVGWIPAPLPAAPIGFGIPIPGDLELVQVGMLSDATPEQGPVYQVTVKNVGSIDAEQFRVSIVAVLGEIAEDSPSVTINVDRIAAGETVTLQIQMPVTVMALGPQGQEPAAFDTMVVAIDSFDELQESNELNNVATLKRTDVQLIQVETVTTEVAPAAAQPTAPAAVAPAAEAPAAPDAAAPAPEDDAPESEDIDIDNLELDDADEATELFTR